MRDSSVMQMAPLGAANEAAAHKSAPAAPVALSQCSDHNFAESEDDPLPADSANVPPLKKAHSFVSTKSAKSDGGTSRPRSGTSSPLFEACQVYTRSRARDCSVAALAITVDNYLWPKRGN